MTALAIIIKYWRLIALGLLLLLVTVAAYYIRSVFQERTALLARNKGLETQLQQAAATIEINNKLTEAIGQIKVRSTINVRNIEKETKPDNSRPFELIPGGVLQAVHSSASADPADRTAPGNAPGGSLSAEQPDG